MSKNLATSQEKPKRAKPLFYIDAPSGLICNYALKALKGRNGRKGVQPLSNERLRR
jgi:hypothetical protein